MTNYKVELAYTHSAAIELYRKHELVENYLFQTNLAALSGIDLDLKDILKKLTGNNILTYWAYTYTFYFGVMVIECYVKPYETVQLWVFVTEEKSTESENQNG